MLINKKPDIKLIALDMDGTLLDDRHEVTEENRRAIKEAERRGVRVVLSTGRSLKTARDYVLSLELSSYLVTVNGGEIWGPNGELVQRSKVDTEHIQWMFELSQKHKTGFWATSSENVWRNNMPKDLFSQEWIKFGFHIEEDEIRESVLKELQDKDVFEISNSSLKNIEVNALGINKAVGLQKVCDLLGISMDNVMAVGDSLNDIAMITEAGLGVAMGNAQETVKEAADDVTGTNQDNGVAQAIEKWVLS
ncbi:Cof-type HAD-IIB family hydrolase [Mesobacillus jeotgali]|uniref:Cof-type HAD-IIB family hydrolase n=1 Tax=Mesobacillus jeotgali TaxID=129985 RepID=UPI0017863290|nr:Cof-type HAD-IIB family hydrolase [Mesobacillus jeotgali]UYZ24412.1 Cof-type HAD-IIB family hydrolase [Mesobacillus jeotgali]